MKKIQVALFGCLTLLLAAPVVSFANMPEPNIGIHAAENQDFLTAAELHRLVSGNTAVGTTPHTHSAYEMYFYPDGRVVWRKNKDNKKIYWGKWWITGNIIHSQCPLYKNGEDFAMHYVKSNTGKNEYVSVDLNGNVSPVFKIYSDVFPSLASVVRKHP